MIGVSFGFELILRIHIHTQTPPTHKRTQCVVYTIQKCHLYKAYDFIFTSENEA